VGSETIDWVVGENISILIEGVGVVEWGAMQHPNIYNIFFSGNVTLGS